MKDYEKVYLHNLNGRERRVRGIFRIKVLLLLLSVLIGCYPPSYYDYRNVPATERYLDWMNSYDYYYPYTYYSPYYYPYSYFPFSFSFGYLYNSYYLNRPHHGYPYRWEPDNSHHYRGRRHR